MAPEKQTHHIPLDLYFKVFGALLVMTALTVIASRIDLGSMNTVNRHGHRLGEGRPRARVLHHLKYDDKIYAVAFGSAVFFLVLLYFFCWIDIYTRIIATQHHMNLLKAYGQLTKSGIILFSVVSRDGRLRGQLSARSSLRSHAHARLVPGLYFTSAGSFALNQAQEWKNDARMPRTRGRPIPLGIFSPLQAYVIGVLLLVPGLFLMRVLGPYPAGLALFTVFLYNGVYTMYWKKRWVFGAVPGAIPGAMPVVIGYCGQLDRALAARLRLSLLVMFLWQMPHFWALAIRFRDDYAKGGFPVMPVKLGVERSLYHIGLYMFTYVGVALTAPFFSAIAPALFVTWCCRCRRKSCGSFSNTSVRSTPRPGCRSSCGPI